MAKQIKKLNEEEKALLRDIDPYIKQADKGFVRFIPLADGQKINRVYEIITGVKQYGSLSCGACMLNKLKEIIKYYKL